MKFALAILAVLATAGSLEGAKIPNVGKGELAAELQDFVDLMPVDDMLMVVLEYLAEDQQFQMAVEYLQSTEFQYLARDVQALPEVKDLMVYIHHAGVDIFLLVNHLNRWIGLDELVPPKDANYAITGGIRGFVDDIEALIPLEKVIELYEQKLKTSTVFADFVAQLESPQFQEIVNKVYANEHFQDLLEKAEAVGIDLVAIKDLLYLILGIKVPTTA